MDKVWFIKINGEKCGPYSMSDLRHDYRITPDTLVWRKGFNKWIPIRKVKELKKVFEDPEASTDETIKAFKSKINLKSSVVALEDEYRPPRFIFWLILFLLFATLYIIYRTNVS